jgi:hypothetical protein
MSEMVKEGSPRWSLGFWFDGFNQAIIEPSQRHPKRSMFLITLHWIN